MGIHLSCGECREMAQRYVIEALVHRAAGYVDFMFGCLRVHGWNMRAIANLVGKGTVGARYDMEGKTLQPGTGAQYNTTTDTITLGNSNAAHVIHEAIHALQDSVRFPTKVTQAEATAYLGQMVYTVAREALDSGASIDSVAKRHEQSSSAIHAAATRVARRLGMFNRCFVVVSAADLSEIEQAIARHPVYSPNAGRDYHFNGHR